MAVLTQRGRIAASRLEDEIIPIAVWDVLRVAPRVIRSFEAGPDGMELICVGGKRPERGDSERIPEFWPS